MAKERKPFKLSGVIDLECAEWDKFVVGAAYDGHRPRVFYNLDDLIDYIRKKGGMWYAHAGGVYDFMAILDRALKRGIACQCDRSQHRISRIVMGSLTLRDSYSLWPVPLDDICGALGRQVPSLPWACVCGRDCGGFCQIGTAARAGDPDLEDYVIADCRALYDGLSLLDEFAIENKITLRGTMGQTAWINAQDDLGVPDAEIDWSVWRHIRAADRGGRMTVIRPRATGPGTHHDICNAYPAQLAKLELPVGAYRQVGTRLGTACLRNARPGIYTVSVNVPEDLFLPPLPWMHGGQMNYPTGRFYGTWALPELGAAIDRGVEIEKIHSAVVWEAQGPIFAELVQRWYDVRKKVGRKTPMGQWIGRLAKSLTGKFAERPERSRVTMHPEAIKICNRQGRCRDGCDGRCGAYEQMDLFGHVWSIPYQRMAPSAYPQWSAYLRASTRLQWLEQAERYGTDLVMGNTDSLFTIGRLQPEPLGDDLGEWEYQGPWWDFEFRSFSNYAYRTQAPIERTEVYYEERRRKTRKIIDHGPLTIRGMPGLTEDDWKRGTGILERGVATFGTAIKDAGKRDKKEGSRERALFRKRVRKWSLPSGDREWYGDRKLGSNGITYPVDAQVLRELAAIRRALRG